MTGRTAHWDQMYATRAIDEVGWYQAVPEMSLELVASSGVGPADRILDVGAGASYLVDELLDRGHGAIVLADLSEVSLGVTRDRVGPRPEVEYVVGSVLDLDVGPVALWHDRAAFHFLMERREQDQYREVMTRHVRDGGHAIIATFAEDGPERCSNLPVCRYAAADLERRFGGEFELVEARRQIHMTPGGVEQPFTFVLLRRFV